MRLGTTGARAPSRRGGSAGVARDSPIATVATVQTTTFKRARARRTVKTQCVVLELMLNECPRALSFKKSEAREVRVFVRHCITRERVEIASLRGRYCNSKSMEDHS